MKLSQQLIVASIVVITIMGATLAIITMTRAASATPNIIGEGTSSNATQIIGNRFFANGTGLAYFSDGAVFPFNHAITPGYGFYYDDSTIFYAGDIPGVTADTNATTTSTSNVSGTTDENNSTIHDVVIPRGFGASSGDVTFQPTVLKIKVGDIVRWINEDWNSVSLTSPPYVGGGSNVTLSDLSLIQDGMNFQEYIQPGETLSIQFTRPGGFHYQCSDVAGTLIVEER